MAHKQSNNYQFQSALQQTDNNNSQQIQFQLHEQQATSPPRFIDSLVISPSSSSLLLSPSLSCQSVSASNQAQLLSSTTTYTPLSAGSNTISPTQIRLPEEAHSLASLSSPPSTSSFSSVVVDVGVCAPLHAALNSVMHNGAGAQSTPAHQTTNNNSTPASYALPRVLAHSTPLPSPYSSSPMCDAGPPPSPSSTWLIHPAANSASCLYSSPSTPTPSSAFSSSATPSSSSLYHYPVPVTSGVVPASHSGPAPITTYAIGTHPSPTFSSNAPHRNQANINHPITNSNPTGHQQAVARLSAAAVNMSAEQKSLLVSHLMHECDLLRLRHAYREAIHLYEQVLCVEPEHGQALNLKGTCHRNLRENVAATECYERALQIAPTDWCAHNNIAIVYKDNDLFDNALAHYKLAIEHGPLSFEHNIAYENIAICITDLGTRLKLSGQTDQAIDTYKAALNYHPAYYPALFNLGVVYSERNEYELALDFYRRALEINPNYVEALCNMGVIHKNRGDLSNSISYYEEALKVNPNFSIASSNLSIALTDMGTQVKNLGRLDEAMTCYKQALFTNSRYPAAWYNLGVAYNEKNQCDYSKLCYEMAIMFEPRCAEAYNNLGVIQKDMGNLDAALAYYHTALECNAQFAQCLNNLAVIYTMLGQLDDAYSYCIRAIKSNPQYAEAHNNLGVLLRDEGRIDEAIAAYEECLKYDPSSRNAAQNRLLALNSLYRPDMPHQAVIEHVFNAHREWGNQQINTCKQNMFNSWNNARDKNRPIRIGYISSDFFTHSVSYFIEAPLKFANPARTHVICYSNVARKDRKTQLLQSYAHEWRCIHDLSTMSVCELIRSDLIDILVDLSGHTAGNRLDVFALKPAPIQVTWIGYPNTTGLPTIDYRLTDAIVDPLGTVQQTSETLIRLPPPFLCYTPLSEAPPVSFTPAIHRGFITFGSFNNLAKVNDGVLACWCRILQSLPNSKMLMKCKPFASASICDKMWKRFELHGISKERVDLMPLLPGTVEHLEMYSGVDISLDCFPYAGTTTTCESLYMGVPVVTLTKLTAGPHAHNVGASILSSIECVSHLVTTSEAQYVSTAISLAQDIQALQNLRLQLRPCMLASQLCNGPAFVKSLEDVYERLFHHYIDSHHQQLT